MGSFFQRNLKRRSLLVFTIFSLNLAYAQNFPAPSVNVVKAEKKVLAPVSWISGTVVSPNDAQIAAEISGRLITIANLGETVKQGEIIARINDRQLTIELQQAQAQVAKEQAQLTYLSSELKRQQQLAKQNLAAKTALDKTIADHRIAQSNLSIAQSKLADIQQKLAYTKLKAPFDGLVVAKLSNLGEYVNSGTAIIRLVQTTHLEASIFAPVVSFQHLLEQQQQKQAIAIQSALGKANVPIKALIPVADSRSHLMELRLDLSSLNWPIGLNIKAAIASGKSQQVIAVPRDALILRRNTISVFTVNDKNKAEQVAVKTGIGAGEWVEVIGKINAGDKVIVRGSERLRSGQSVNIKSNNNNLISSNINK